MLNQEWSCWDMNEHLCGTPTRYMVLYLLHYNSWLRLILVNIYSVNKTQSPYAAEFIFLKGMAYVHLSR